jgi:hypothetical protein
VSAPEPWWADGLRAALATGCPTHSLEDVLEQVACGDARLWETPDAVVVTEIHEYPRCRVLHFWLATGELGGVVELTRQACADAKELGCTWATIAGRKGWERVLSEDGWKPKMVILSREL